MKQLLKWIAIVLGLVVIGVGIGAAYVAATPIPSYPVEKIDLKVDVTPERGARGKRTAEMTCAACHLDPTTGAPTGRRVDVPPEFGESWSLNITRHPVEGVGAWTDGEIAYLLRTGIARDGRYTPPWMLKLPLLADEELRDLIAFLRSDDPLLRPMAVANRSVKPSLLAKVLANTVFEPLPWPTTQIVAPSPADRVAYGRYLLTAPLRCHECHSQHLNSVDPIEPEKSAGYLSGGYAMKDRAGRTIYSTNLTPDLATGLGAWSEEEFRRTLKMGIRPDGRAL